MSCNYAEGLSPYEHKGKLGLPEKWDDPDAVDLKVAQLAEWIRSSRHVVLHTGAGISTSAGIPDFRGPKGVWTLEEKGLKPQVSLQWNEARPTATHLAIARLVQEGVVQFVISQNIDGLHLRSGIPRTKLAELHGNMFVDQCNACQRQFVRASAAETVGQKVSESSCPAPKPNGRSCRGRLADFVLDWEHELPELDLDLAEAHSSVADLSIVLGSTLQIIPSGNLPTYTKKFSPEGGKLVIINLQPTKQDKKADLIIHDYVDKVMEKLCNELDLKASKYDSDGDPINVIGEMLTKNKFEFIEWTQNAQEVKVLKKLADAVTDEYKKKRKDTREKAKKQKVNVGKDKIFIAEEENFKLGDSLNDNATSSDSDTGENERKKIKLEDKFPENALIDALAEREEGEKKCVFESPPVNV